MRVLVDTPIWSLALRRKHGDLSRGEKQIVLGLQDLIHARSAVLIGSVRQETLSGIENNVAFERIRDELSEFPDEPIEPADYEEAARCFNRLSARGIASSATDCLICGVALNRRISVFTLDHDFKRYHGILSLQLFDPSAVK